MAFFFGGVGFQSYAGGGSGCIGFRDACIKNGFFFFSKLFFGSWHLDTGLRAMGA